MKQLASVQSKKTKPSKELVEKVVRQLCKQAGENPDDVIVWAGDYGYGKYSISKWRRFVGPAKKLIAKGEPDA